MKTQVSIFAFIIFISVFLITCNPGDGTDTENDTIILPDTNSFDENSNTLSVTTDSVSVNETKKEKIVSKYICPLGDPEGNVDKPGICPVCEMELIENPDYIRKKSQ